MSIKKVRSRMDQSLIDFLKEERVLGRYLNNSSRSKESWVDPSSINMAFDWTTGTVEGFEYWSALHTKYTRKQLRASTKAPMPKVDWI